MSTGLHNFFRISGEGVRRWTQMAPEEREAEKSRNTQRMAEEGAAEQARYNALSDAEKVDYDRLTEGMMPRLRRP